MQAQNTASISISQKQARAFAAAVFADIRAYREAHQAEYEEFLREEQAKGDAENEPNKKAEQIGA